MVINFKVISLLSTHSLHRVNRCLNFSSFNMSNNSTDSFRDSVESLKCIERKLYSNNGRN